MEPINFIFKKIGFTEDFRCFKKKELIEFRPGVNLLVGDQGCGKSSLIYAIINWQESGIAADMEQHNNGFLFLDTEKMNPRMDNAWKNKKYKSKEEYDKAKFDCEFDSHFIYNEKSHGQVMLKFVLGSKQSAEEGSKTVFIDEPESGLSIRSQYKLVDLLKDLAKNNQVFVATHSLIIMQEFKEVLSLEHKKWMSTEEFIKTQK